MKILITGATGLVGLKLVETLFLKGHTDIRILSRNKEKAKKKFPFPVELYEWNPSTNYIEPTALDNVNIVIHLAGENVAKGRWTNKNFDRIKSILFIRLILYVFGLMNLVKSNLLILKYL